MDITTPDGSQITLHVDPESRQVVRVRSRAYHPNLGDVEAATAFRDYADAGGLMLPEAITRTIDRQPISVLRVSHTVDADIGDLAAPADVASAPEPGPPAANVTDEALADGIWLLAGQSHHSVLIELPEQAVLVEAPQHDTRTLAAIARARELVPDKPLSHVVNTHHHFDHSGGIRAAVAEGLTVITHETNRALFEELASRPHTIVADHLARQPAELMLETVAGDDTLELGEGRRTMQVFRMGDNPHADGALLVYLPTERMLIQADMFIPGVGGEFAETAAALLAGHRGSQPAGRPARADSRRGPAAERSGGSGGGGGELVLWQRSTHSPGSANTHLAGIDQYAGTGVGELKARRGSNGASSPGRRPWRQADGIRVATFLHDHQPAPQVCTC